MLGVAYAGAAVVILLAIAVGIFRLMLPRLPEYEEEIKAWAGDAIGMQVEFAGMNARWRLSGPELSFFGAGLSHRTSGAEILSADEVSIGVGLLNLLVDRELVVDRVSVSGTSIDIRQDGDGNWTLQDVPVDSLLDSFDMPADSGRRFELVGSGIDVSYEHPSSGQLVPFRIRSMTIAKSSVQMDVEADIDLPDEFGNRVEVAANRGLGDSRDDHWRLYVEADSVDLAGWSRLQQYSLPRISAGTADFVLWTDIADRRVSSASANVVVSGLQTEPDGAVPPFDLQGSFEYSAESGGWLLGANQLRLVTADGSWPQSTLQLSVEENEDRTVEAIRASASYFNLGDLAYLKAWFPEDRRELLDRYAPTGVMTEVTVNRRGPQAELPEFDVSAEFEAAGFAAANGRPGVRKFSGRVRADRDGGRVEIESTNLVVDLGAELNEPVVLDDAIGTIIWRRNAEGILILSDSVQIRNADFDSRMSLQVSIPADGSSPIVDFQSDWSVFDVSSVRRYLPVRLVKPKLYDWLSNALVSGYARRGTTRLNGALDRFPFDDGSGVFRIEARIEDATVQYAPDWPAPEFHHLDLIVENTRLYSTENFSNNLGNFVEDALIDIPDLREPVLTIESFATGTLQSIKDYVAASPISAVFGGQLDRVDVDGEASFDLSLTLPIRQLTDYEFSTTIRASDGTVRIAGLEPPITELNGMVTITRDDISSDSLFGLFLGRPVDLALNRVGNADAPYNVVLTGRGRTTVPAMQAGFSLPLEDFLSGDAEYEVTVRFPNGRASQRSPLQVLVETDLYGIQTRLPAPLAKSDEESLPLSLNIEFPGENEISTAGSLAGEVNWTGRFVKSGDAWDFDRGVIAFGDYPREADIRGLHIYGQLNEVRLHEWLAESRRSQREAGFGDRIRTIELGVDRLYAVGQMYADHRVRVDRSGRDWVIQIEGEQAEGTITVPYDFDAGRPMTLDMDRLILPGDDAAAEAEEAATLDPRALPALSITARDFGLGDRRFGALEAEFERTSRGLQSTSLKTTAETFSIEGGAGWVIDAYEESGQRTFIQATLNSSNVRTTARQLDYDPGIDSDSMQIGLDIGWAGGPRKDFMAYLNGEVSVRLGEGRLSDVDPGAGRVFGLMSIAALPRRLSLDFSDVFESGFGYDEITGDFRLVNGDAFTCNLTLVGPAADVGIVGRAGLTSRDYDQAAIVSANVGNTLPVAGFFLGGPQVAAALLVFSQLFKKPLKDVGQVFYSVTGSWDEPAIESADSQVFASASGRAGCIDTE